MSKLLRVEKITKAFNKKVVLSNVSFDLDNNEILVLVGENGTGKSTFLSILVTLLKPDLGHIFLEGDDIVTNANLIKGKVAYVPQEIAIYPNLTVKDNMYFWASINGFSGVKCHDRVRALIDEFKLSEYEKQKAGKLSVGLRRRLSIATSMFLDAKLVIMDEPTAGLDIEAKNEIIKLVKTLKKQGRSIIYVTHIQDEIEALAGKILRIKDGVSEYYDNVAEYYVAIK